MNKKKENTFTSEKLFSSRGRIKSDAVSPYDESSFLLSVSVQLRCHGKRFQALPPKSIGLELAAGSGRGHDVICLRFSIQGLDKKPTISSIS
jgi:hypothetical protein